MSNSDFSIEEQIDGLLAADAANTASEVSSSHVGELQAQIVAFTRHLVQNPQSQANAQYQTSTKSPTASLDKGIKGYKGYSYKGQGLISKLSEYVWPSSQNSAAVMATFSCAVIIVILVAAMPQPQVSSTALKQLPTEFVSGPENQQNQVDSQDLVWDEVLLLQEELAFLALEQTSLEQANY